MPIRFTIKADWCRNGKTEVHEVIIVGDKGRVFLHCPRTGFNGEVEMSYDGNQLRFTAVLQTFTSKFIITNSHCPPKNLGQIYKELGGKLVHS